MTPRQRARRDRLRRDRHRADAHWPAFWRGRPALPPPALDIVIIDDPYLDFGPGLRAEAVAAWEAFAEMVRAPLPTLVFHESDLMPASGTARALKILNIPRDRGFDFDNPFR
jgi:hypothetical protein